MANILNSPGAQTVKKNLLNYGSLLSSAWNKYKTGFRDVSGKFPQPVRPETKNIDALNVQSQPKPQPPSYPNSGGVVPATPQILSPQNEQPIQPKIASTQFQTQPLPKIPTTESTIPSPGATTMTSEEKAYQDNLKIGADELSTQEDLDKLLESARTGYQNTKGQSIPMEFITGQLKSVEERANLLKEPLERKLARLQAQRLANTEASKFALERSDKQKGEAFTLGEGQTRYDAYGNPIATSQKPGTTQDTKQQQYSSERTTRTLGLIDEAMKDISGWTTGAGSVLGFIPGTAARDFKAKIDSIKANIGFNELNEMRAASQTGGALGQVAVQELNFLQSVLGSLDVGQSTEQLKSNMENIKTRLENWQNTKQQYGASGSAGTGSVVQTLAGPVSTDW